MSNSNLLPVRSLFVDSGVWSDKVRDVSDVNSDFPVAIFQHPGMQGVVDIRTTRWVN